MDCDGWALGGHKSGSLGGWDSAEGGDAHKHTKVQAHTFLGVTGIVMSYIVEFEVSPFIQWVLLGNTSHLFSCQLTVSAPNCASLIRPPIPSSFQNQRERLRKGASTPRAPKQAAMHHQPWSAFQPLQWTFIPTQRPSSHCSTTPGPLPAWWDGYWPPLQRLVSPHQPPWDPWAPTAHRYAKEEGVMGYFLVLNLANVVVRCLGFTGGWLGL